MFATELCAPLPTRESMVERRSPVFILGCGRSGTTLMRLMLNSHPCVAIPGETWFFPDIHGERDTIAAWPETEWRVRFADRIQQFATFPELGVTRAELLTELDLISRQDWPALVAVVNRAFARVEGKPRWGDKTPGYVRYMRVLKELYPDAVVIHMIRDGRDVVLSFLGQKFGPTRILEGADYWRTHVGEGRSLGPTLFGSNYHEIRYEELVADPERVLRRVCAAIGETYHPRMLAYADTADRYLLREHTWHDHTRKPVNRSRVERWQREMSQDDQALFELVAGRLLSQLGYPTLGIRTVNALRRWGADRALKSWRMSTLKAKLAIHRAFRSA